MLIRNVDKNTCYQNSFEALGAGDPRGRVDMFVRKGTPVLSATSGIVVYIGDLTISGKMVVALSQKLKFRYYPYLKKYRHVNFNLFHPAIRFRQLENTKSKVYACPLLDCIRIKYPTISLL